MFLSFKEIKDRCYIPTHKLVRTIPNVVNGKYEYVDDETLIAGSEEEINQLKESCKNSLFPQSISELSEAEKEQLTDFKPLIENYADEFVINSTDTEQATLKQFNDGYVATIDTALSVGKDEFKAYCLQPGEFATCKTVEIFNIPDDLSVFIQPLLLSDQSKAIISTTAISPGYSGQLDITIYNPSDDVIIFHRGQGILKLSFMQFQKG